MDVECAGINRDIPIITKNTKDNIYLFMFSMMCLSYNQSSCATIR